MSKTVHIGKDDCFDIIITDPKSKHKSIMYNDEFIVFGGMGDPTESMIMCNDFNLYIKGELAVKSVANALFNNDKRN